MSYCRYRPRYKHWVIDHVDDLIAVLRPPTLRPNEGEVPKEESEDQATASFLQSHEDLDASLEKWAVHNQEIEAIIEELFAWLSDSSSKGDEHVSGSQTMGKTDALFDLSLEKGSIHDVTAVSPVNDKGKTRMQHDLNWDDIRTYSPQHAQVEMRLYDEHWSIDDWARFCEPCIADFEYDYSGDSIDDLGLVYCEEDYMLNDTIHTQQYQDVIDMLRIVNKIFELLCNDQRIFECLSDSIK